MGSARMFLPLFKSIALSPILAGIRGFCVQLFGILLFGLTAAGEPLDFYIRDALQNSSSLQASYENYSARKHMVSQAKALPDPRLSYGNFIRSVETRVGPQRHRFSLQQPIPWFGTLSLKADAADASAKAALYEFLAAKNSLVFAVAQAYVELAYLHAAEQATIEAIQLLQSWEGVLQERFRTGSGTHSDLIRVQIELGTQENALNEYVDSKLPKQAALNALLNRDTTDAILIDANFLHGDTPLATEHDVDETIMFANNPELLLLKAESEALKANLGLARKKSYPDLTLGLDYIMTGDREVADGGKDAIVGQVSFNIPFNRASRTAAVREALAKKQGVFHRLEAKKKSLSASLAAANFELRNSRRKIKLYKKTLIPKTQESIEASYTAYEAGDASFFNVIESEEKLLNFQLALSRARANHITASYKLAELAGGFSELPDSISEKRE